MPYKDPAAHRDATNAYQRAYYQRNLEKERARRRAKNARYRAKNREKLRQQARERNARPEIKARRKLQRPNWKVDKANNLKRSAARLRAHPEIRLFYQNKRRARQINATRNDLTLEQQTLLLTLANGVCVLCQYYKPDCPTCKRHRHKLTIDHITPVASNGDNTLWNLAAVCGSCNSRKGNRALPGPIQPLLL